MGPTAFPSKRLTLPSPPTPSARRIQLESHTWPHQPSRRSKTNEQGSGRSSHQPGSQSDHALLASCRCRRCCWDRDATDIEATDRHRQPMPLYTYEPDDGSEATLWKDKIAKGNLRTRGRPVVRALRHFCMRNRQTQQQQQHHWQHRLPRKQKHQRQNNCYYRLRHITLYHLSSSCLWSSWKYRPPLATGRSPINRAHQITATNNATNYKKTHMILTARCADSIFIKYVRFLCYRKNWVTNAPLQPLNIYYLFSGDFWDGPGAFTICY